jgi:uncharacterized protein YjlB
MNNKLIKPSLIEMPEKIPHYFLEDNGIFPNSVLPVLLYKTVFLLPNDHAPGIIEEVFEENGWSNSWRNGIYDYNHYHSITHEVLGIYSGHCFILLGGDSGVQLLLEKGDTIIIPAGVSHRNIGSTADFKCIGAYPDGADFDINPGKSGERPGTDENIKKLPVPKSDPLYGNKGLLFTYWKKTTPGL